MGSGSWRRGKGRETRGSSLGVRKEQHLIVTVEPLTRGKGRLWQGQWQGGAGAQRAGANARGSGGWEVRHGAGRGAGDGRHSRYHNPKAQRR